MRVVATLTTRPNYHKCLKKNLDSLTKQFDEVYLGLPETSSKGVKYPDFSHDNVTIVKLDKDIGPCCKLLGALIKEERSKDTLIVSVDDDFIYPENLRNIFENHRKKDIKNNLNRVLTFSGTYIKYWNFGCLTNYLCLGLNGGWHDKDYFFDYKKEKKITTIAGGSGCAYPASIFGKTEEFINFCENSFLKHEKLFFNDDIVISAYLANNNIDRIRLNYQHLNFNHSNEDINEKLSPSPSEIFNCSKSLKKYFLKNNPSKYYSPVLLDIIVAVIMFFILILILYKYKE